MHERLTFKGIQALNDALDPAKILDILLRRWRVICAVVAAVVIPTIIVLYMITPLFSSTVQLLLDPRKKNVLGADAIVSELVLDTSTVDSQVTILKSRTLLRRVVESEKLTDDEEFGGSGSSGFFDWLRSMLPSRGQAPSSADPSAIDPKILNSISRLQRALEVERLGRTFVLGIAVTSRSRDKAAQLANAIAGAYILDQLEARYESARRASDWLSGRLDRLRNELRESENEVSQYRAQHNLVAAVSGNVTEQQLSELNTKLVAARAETAERKAKFDQTQRIFSEGGNLQSVPDVLRSSVISNLRSQQAEVTRREADLVSRYGERHPAVVNVRAEKSDVDRQIRAEVGRIVANLKNDYDVANSRQTSLEQSLGILTGQPGSNNVVAVRLRELERIASANRTLYETFLSRFKLSEEQTSLEVREGRIISAAVPPRFPSYPSTTVFITIAGVLGLGGGIGLAFVLELMRQGFSTPNEIEKALDVPVFSSIPFLSAKELTVGGKVLSPPGYMMTKPFSRYSEAIRSARAGIQMSDIDQTLKLIQVTSTLPAEGKTTTALSIAFSAIAAYPRILIVDCDLRRPAASKFFGLEKKQGLVDVLIGSSSLERAIFRDSAMKVHVLPAGTTAQNPPDLLASGRMENVLNQLREQYDYVLIDSPPVGLVVDAVVLSKIIDKVLFVVAWDSTPRDAVAHAVRQFQPERKIAGIVVNLLDASKTTRYGGYHYYSKSYDRYYTR